MSANITLKVIAGDLKNQQFVFNERSTCLIGRAPDCHPKLPDDEAHKTISRYHCLLDINPPQVRIRDFGSLNGTFVNDRNIGQRATNIDAKAATLKKFNEYNLQHGDTIKLGKTVFEIIISGQTTQPPPAPTSEKNTGAVTINPSLTVEHANRQSGQKPQLAMVKKLLGSANRNSALQAIKGYQIIREIGRGGMSTVYLANNEETNEQVALKVMQSQIAINKSVMERFDREFKLTKAINHQNVVKIYEYCNTDDALFFTLEYCNAGSMKRLIRQHQGQLPLDLAMELIFQLLDAIAYTHNLVLPATLTDNAKGIIHRDIKPSNFLLVEEQGKIIPKISDYGLAKNFDMAGLGGLTRTGQIGGTPSFMPRQQVINFKYAKAEVDVWAIAASLYYMLTSATPREFSKNKDPWMVVLQETCVPIQNKNPKIPKKLADVIDAALIDKPKITFRTADTLKQALIDAC